jgi:iron complex outermembrane receptor protein
MSNTTHFSHERCRPGLHRLLLSGAAVTGLLQAGVTCAADTSDDAELGKLEEVTVTATFREARLQDTPIAITAVTAEMLEQRSQSNVFEIARQAPNVSLAPQGQGYGPTMLAFIRGVGQTDFAFALEPGVGIYVDDVYYSTLTGSLIDLLDIDRVEVLRGPQGTLAGRNSIGGAIKLFSKKPSAGSGGSVSVTYGAYNRLDATAIADLALVPDKLFARIAGISKSRDGFIDRVDYACTHPSSGVPASASLGDGCKLGTLGGQSLTGGRVSLRWLASEAVEVSLIGDAMNDKSEAGGDVLRSANSPFTTIDDGNPLTPPVSYDCRFVPYGPGSCDPNGRNPYLSYATFADPSTPTSQQPFKPLAIPAISHLTHQGVSGMVDWKLSDRFQLKSITAYRTFEATFGEDVDGSPIASQLALQTLTHTQKSQELRLNGTVLDEKLDFTTGLFWFEQDGEFAARIDLPYVGLDFNHGPDRTPAKSRAAFVNSTLHATDSLNLSAGVRYSKDEKQYDYFRYNPDGTVPSTPCLPGLAPFDPANAPNCALVGLNNLRDGSEGHRTDWRITVDYRLSGSVMTYGQVSTGYRSGGVNPRPFFGPGTLLPVLNGQINPAGQLTDVNQLKSFGPETITSYELGAKTDLLDRRLRLNVAAFYNDYNDIILSSQACPIAPCYQPNNVGAAKVKGLELETEFRPTAALAFDLSASWLDFGYTRTDEATTGVSNDMVTPFTPKEKVSAGAQYTFALGNAGNLTARLDGSYQAEVYTEAINSPFNRIDAYVLANARLAWTSTDDTWNAALELTNLGDEYYELSRFDQHLTSSTVSANPGPPRMWAVTLRRTF